MINQSFRKTYENIHLDEGKVILSRPWIAHNASIRSSSDYDFTEGQIDFYFKFPPGEYLESHENIWLTVNAKREGFDFEKTTVAGFKNNYFPSFNSVRVSVVCETAPKFCEAALVGDGNFVIFGDVEGISTFIVQGLFVKLP